ncbi:glycerophosphodiester phosphodiesterase family protein [Desmospora profundinema]|uniref:Glycerophosphoryl diester phosphodiesterase n=1 Tax=Desmospora profundinema TaxID=1571184 RepID=A0ABU1IQU3_9BACL|nr:glycerophosphodiester phosphodiesterase family protein [Desmospora profundinema]MDR6227076.1 glycerophosphoryl diester phosphodiesterase [Desmospora profundinema]
MKTNGGNRGWKGLLWITAAVVAVKGGWGVLTPAPAEAVALPSSPATENIAHRGASGHAPESTLPAFRLANRMGADWIELDVHQTRDGELAVIHDKSVNRTTNGQGAVKNLTLSQLKRLDAGSWFDATHPKQTVSYRGARIPTLEEVLLSQGKQGRFCIEIKEGLPVGVEKQVLDTLKRHGLLPRHQPERVMIQSFDPHVLKRIRQSHPRLTLVQLIHFREAGSLSRPGLQQIADYADAIGYHQRRMERDDIRRAHREGLRIHAYTVNRKKKMRQLMDWGVDAICTNFPDRLRDVKRERHR